LGIDEEIVKAQIQSNFETVFKHKLWWILHGWNAPNYWWVITVSKN
jgi:hypothetical protein